MILPLKKNENSKMKLLIKERNKEKFLVHNYSDDEEEANTIVNDDEFCEFNPYYKGYKNSEFINNINTNKYIIMPKVIQGFIRWMGREKNGRSIINISKSFRGN